MPVRELQVPFHVNIIQVGRVPLHRNTPDVQSRQIPELHGNVPFGIDLPRGHLRQVALVRPCRIGRSPPGLVRKIPVHGKLHRRAGMHARAGFQLVAELPILHDLRRCEINRRKPGHRQEPATVHPVPVGIPREVMEYSPANIIHVQPRLFPFFQFQGHHPVCRVHALHRAVGDGVPQLSADHIHPVKPQFRHFKELPQRQSRHLGVPVLVHPRPTAADHPGDERPDFQVLEHHIALRLHGLIHVIVECMRVPFCGIRHLSYRLDLPTVRIPHDGLPVGHLVGQPSEITGCPFPRGVNGIQHLAPVQFYTALHLLDLRRQGIL